MRSDEGHADLAFPSAAIFNSQMTQIFDLCPNLMCGDIRLGEEREKSMENYMWK